MSATIVPFESKTKEKGTAVERHAAVVHIYTDSNGDVSSLHVQPGDEAQFKEASSAFKRHLATLLFHAVGLISSDAREIEGPDPDDMLALVVLRSGGEMTIWENADLDSEYGRKWLAGNLGRCVDDLRENAKKETNDNEQH